MHFINASEYSLSLLDSLVVLVDAQKALHLGDLTPEPFRRNLVELVVILPPQHSQSFLQVRFDDHPGMRVAVLGFKFDGRSPRVRLPIRGTPLGLHGRGEHLLRR